MANILYISYDGMTDALGQSQVIPYLLGLVQKGHSVHILSTEKEENYKQKKDQINELLSGKIGWSNIVYTKKPPLISTLKDIDSLWRKSKILHQKYGFDIIHCRSYISALIGIKMKNKFKTKFVFDMRGFWADERVDGKIWNLSNPIFKIVYNYFKKKEIEFLENADAVISLTHNAKNKILDFDKVRNQPVDINVIPCCVDTKKFDPNIISKNNTQELKQQLGIKEGEFVLTYLGSIGTWYMLEEMLDFFKVLLLKKPNAKFVFITGENSNYIIEESQKREIPLKNIIVTKTDYTKVPLYLSISNYAIFFILPVFSKSASSPIKQGEIMSMGIPIICNSGVGDTDFVIENYNCGVLITKFTEEDYSKAIEKIDSLNFDSNKIRNAAQDFYSLEKGINNYDKTYKSIAK